ncbi:30S ribosomal protein S10, mitochondrial precursor [Aspergillus ibericus CBS 121593]|uniref:Small ribosomal subunit protein uS10m n=1 Tax=Aspergillus ibericus CBS 121593 TaxID=1448316 RepID=A0A395GLS2_9EURO|nr:30S ribosomal protein S10, mitochondrial precursor [Aspergillus ibericus CBS 121593]RAK96419.1 30S ribosomal protein S10, mitochondrial precursor [Aspergillus ibericus CBS 121593]
MVRFMNTIQAYIILNDMHSHMLRKERLDSINSKARLPRSVQAVYLRPLRRKAEYGLPVCDLQLRSYSVRNVEFFADFAVRAAYYLKLPVSGPVPLPRMVERWTMPRSNFVHKKSQENFERITLRRLIQIKDGNPQVVQAWLAFLRKHAFYGVGMKANVWEHESLDVAESMDSTLPDVEKTLEPYLSQFGQREDTRSQDSISDILDNERFVAYRGPLTTVRKAGFVCHPILTVLSCALREWVRLQDDATEGTTLYFSIVDLHALTVPQESAQLRRWRKEAFATLLAVGLDPSRSTIFYQSSVQAHAELFWILCTVASMGYLSRMTQWKSKLQLPDDTTLDTSAARSKLRLGLFSYPVLQAADILVHRATHVPVGEDQKQHLEFSRNIANSFNHVYGSVFPSPEALISPAKRVMSLKEPTQKMSKSHVDERSRVLLTDSPDQIHKKIKAALTDSDTMITYDPIRRPGVSNLLELLGHFEGKSCQDLASEYQSTSLRALKENLARQISSHLRPIRDKYLSIMGDNSCYLDDVSEQGAQAARSNAESTMKQVREVMGL